MRMFRSTMRACFAIAAGLVFVLILLQGVAGAEKRLLMRFPDMHDDTIVFVYGEDIWSVPAAGGVATRLTIHDGGERFPKFSPDGAMIAFTGEYDGNADVYVMNVHGGNITRVTWQTYSLLSGPPMTIRSTGVSTRMPVNGKSFAISPTSRHCAILSFLPWFGAET